MPPSSIDELDEAIAATERRLAAIRAEVCRRALKTFVLQAWAEVEHDREFVNNWHIDVLCNLLESLTAGELKRLIINVPPGTMKSLLLVFWIAWVWASDPSKRFLRASYSASLSIRDNLRLRDIITSEWYQQNFGLGAVSEEYEGLELNNDQNAKQRFNTTAGGWCIATSVNGLGTGEHPDYIVIDDPQSADDARSDKERQSVNDWFDRTISSRGVSRGVAIIVIQQRLHEDDLAGHLLSKGGWELVCFPMRYETERANEPTWRPDPRDPRREAGTLLWDALFPEESVRQLELDLGPYGTAGQLQQRPAPEGGGLFKRHWFGILDAVPANITRRVRGWDTAATEGDGDYSCGVKIGETTESIVIVEHVVRDQVSPDGLDKLMKITADSDQCPQREEKEPAAAGKAVIAARSKLLKGHDYREAEKSGDKITRAKPFRSQCEAGNVFLIRGDWNEAYISELCGFPVGKHDDQVDASSCAYNQMLLEPVVAGFVTW